MIKRYHEAPISIFPVIQAHTDGDYALVHLFEHNQVYYKMFEDAVAHGRDVILDNSLFELGEAFDEDRFAYWVRRLQPTWYIVPDAWKDCEQTASMFSKFVMRYNSLPGKVIGVAQGNTVEEVAWCYQQIEPYCDMVAFNLDFSSVYYRNEPRFSAPYCCAMSWGRYSVIRDLFEQGVINTEKPHHLLGCGVPQEVRMYPRRWTWIRSIDTCSPVMAGMCKLRYDPDGLRRKPNDKMCDNIDRLVTDEELDNIMHNIELITQWCADKEENDGSVN